MRDPLRIVFLGSSHFGLRCLDLARSLPGIEIAGAVTAPKTFPISYRPTGVTNVLHADVAAYAKDHSIPVAILLGSMNDAALMQTVSSWKPDLFLVAGWYHLIPRAWREMAPAYGLHASLLPDYSGGAPLVWAMINGESRTGITLFKMDDGVDTGPIVGQLELAIESRDTIATLYGRIEEQGLALLREALPKLADGTAVLQDQPMTGRRIMPQRGPEDGLIDWSKDSTYIDLFIRAQTKPYSGAHTTLDGERITIWAAHSTAIPANGFPVGGVIHTSALCAVSCGKGAVQLEEIEINGQTIGSLKIREYLPFGKVLGVKARAKRSGRGTP